MRTTRSMRRATSLATLVGALAAAAPAPAQADDTVDCTHDKTYFPRGDHWAVVPPASSNPIIIRHQKDGPSQQSPVPIQTVTKVIDAAFRRWTQADCGNGSPNIEVLDGLAVSLPEYEFRDRGDFVASGDPDAWTVQNIMYWVEDAAGWDAGSLTVAQTISLFTENTDLVVTSDIEFNGVHYDWRATDTTTGTHFGCTRGEANCYDIYSVALHEAGHFFGLNHVQCSDAVMFPHGAGTVENTELSKHELAGMCHLYRPRNESVAERDTGERCSSDDECPQSPTHVCVKPPSFPTNTDYGWCALRCTSTGACPLGFVCADYTVGGGAFCKPGLHLDDGPPAGGVGNCIAQQWTCTNGECVDLGWRCDGFPDCGDSSDESHCGDCGNDAWICSSSDCIPSSWLCNGVPDCDDGSDEQSCSCGQGEWTCLDGTCIGSAQVCDGSPDCRDGSDEAGCDSTGRVDDLCLHCSDGTQCAGGICVSAPSQGDPICSQRCMNVPGLGCPPGFACLETAAGWSACYPQSSDACWGQAERVGLNQRCYMQSDPHRPGYEWRRDCGPGLVCFRFRQRAIGQEGSCVSYCNGADPGRQCPQGTTCCAGVDDTGACIPPSPGNDHGGCFQIRSEGESCVTAEQSMCAFGTECVAFGYGELAKCYRRCDSLPCAPGQQCAQFLDGANDPVALCCDAERYRSNEPSTCAPTQGTCTFDLGASCISDAECQSGLCLGTSSGGVCSRDCDAVTGGGCPADSDDVDGDGDADGGFECRIYEQGGRCYPKRGPLPPPECSGRVPAANPPPPPAPGGCCSAVVATRTPLGDLILNAPLWLLIGGRWWRRRRSAVRYGQ